MTTTTAKATPAMKSFVRRLKGPHEVLEAIETGTAAYAAASNDTERVAAIFLTHTAIANIEGHEVAMDIVDKVFTTHEEISKAIEQRQQEQERELDDTDKKHNDDIKAIQDKYAELSAKLAEERKQHDQDSPETE